MVMFVGSFLFPVHSQLLYFLKISPRQDFISRPSLVRRQFEGGVYRDRHAHAYTASIISLFVCMYNARAYTYIAGDPLPCGEISRAADELQKTCGEISRRQDFDVWRDFEEIRYLHTKQTTMKSREGI